LGWFLVPSFFITFSSFFHRPRVLDEKSFFSFYDVERGKISFHQVFISLGFHRFFIAVLRRQN